MVRDHGGRDRRPGAARRTAKVALGLGALLVGALGTMGMAAVAVGMAALPAGASSATFTWTGADANSASSPDFFWSDGNNWSGGSAPSGTVGSLDFPSLSSCVSNGCVSDDDVSLSTGAVDISGGDYIVPGVTESGGTSTLTVGSGGITVSGSQTAAEMVLPIDLSSAQTWSVPQAGSLTVAGTVTGASDALTLDVGGSSDVALVPNESSSADDEVGPVDVVGADTADTGINAVENGGLVLASLSSGQGVDVDSSDGQTTTVTDAAVSGSGTTGPLAVDGGLLAVGSGTNPTGSLGVEGPVTLDASSAFSDAVADGGDTAGTDYGQLSATGAVNLGGSTLEMGMSANTCAAPAAGTIYTIVTTPAAITGTFSAPGGGAVPDGSSVPLLPSSGCSPTGETLIVHYNTATSPETVTATVAGGSAAAGSSSATSVTASTASVTTGSSVTYTAAVSPVPSGGTVAFDDSGVSIPGCSAQPVSTSGSTAGEATCTVTYPVAGTHQVTAAFSGTGTGSGAETGSTSAPVTVTVTNGTSSPPPGSPGSGGSPAPAASSQGYAETTNDGWVFVFGAARSYGSLPADGVHVDDIVGVAPGTGGAGYWLVGADGGVFGFGDAGYHGSLPADGIHVDDIVGVAPGTGGAGYWLVGADGGVFGFGDAGYHGSLPADGIHVDDIVGMAPTPGGAGYWLVGADGGVFGFGDAGYHGSLPADGIHVDDIVGMAATPGGGGYWLVGADGGVFAFGDAGYHGAASASGVHDRVVAIVSSPTGDGYWEVGVDGGIFAYGDAGYLGSLPGFGVKTTDVVAAGS